MANTAQLNAKQSLFGLINDQRPIQTVLTDSNTFTTAPSRREDKPRGRNTSMEIHPLATSGIIGRVRLYYNRIHLSTLGSISVEQKDQTSLYGLLGAINALKGTGLTPADVEDQVFPPNTSNGGKITITLVAKPTSYLFYGESIIVGLAIPPFPNLPPAEGTLIDQGCHGLALVGTYADGEGGFTEEVIEAESTFCGYVAPMDRYVEDGYVADGYSEVN